MPGKRVQAELRALLPKSRFLRDSWFLEDYVSSLKNVIENGFAEKVPDCELRWSDGRVYYIILHHSIYHKKGEKLTVFFDCSAQFHGASLSDELP